MGHETKLSTKKKKKKVPKGDSKRRNEFSLEGNSFSFSLQLITGNSEFGRVWCSCQMFFPKVPHPDLKRNEMVDTQSLWGCLG